MIIKPNFDNLISLSEFELGWRFESSHNNCITSIEKRKIFPFNKEESRSLNKTIDFFENPDNLQNNFVESERFGIWQDKQTEIEKFRQLFLHKTDGFTDNIFISWRRTEIVYTTKEIFAKYWTDFCYPISDDVTIISELTNWVLFYNHIETGSIWKRIE